MWVLGTAVVLMPVVRNVRSICLATSDKMLLSVFLHAYSDQEFHQAGETLVHNSAVMRWWLA